jgi:hypothetical protein
LHVKPSAKESKEPETKEPRAIPEESSAKELTELVTKQPSVIPIKSSAKESSKPEMTEPNLIPIKSPVKESSKPEMTEPKLIAIKSPEKKTGIKFKIKKNTASDITQKRAKKSSKQSLNRVPDSPMTTQSAQGEKAKQLQIKQAESVTSIGKNYNLQTYMLILLNFLTIVIILLLSINLLKKKSGIHSEHPGKISDSLRTADESIAAIDAMINREFKKHD